jgi:hypothetical protein
MKAIILDGSERDDRALARVRELLVSELASRRWEIESIALCDLEIHHCLGCFSCWVQNPGECVIRDDGPNVARAVVGSDLLVYLTPVTFGGYSSQLKKAVDRLICLVSPFFTRIEGEVHHKPRYERYPRLVGLGLLPEEDRESGFLFAQLVCRNALNLHAPASASGVVWSDQENESIRESIGAVLDTVEVMG